MCLLVMSLVILLLVLLLLLLLLLLLIVQLCTGCPAECLQDAQATRRTEYHMQNATAVGYWLNCRVWQLCTTGSSAVSAARQQFSLHKHLTQFVLRWVVAVVKRVEIRI
jgi:hypothetical protein